MTTTANSIQAHLDTIMNKEIEEHYDIADGCVAASDIEASIQNETEVHPMFLEEPDSYVGKDWFTDLFNDNYINARVEQSDVEVVIDSFLSTLAVLGINAELNIIGKRFSIDDGLVSEQED
ncbi:TPA: hypothetical protein ACTXF0_003722 [Klebsiella pneumoniae]